MVVFISVVRYHLFGWGSILMPILGLHVNEYEVFPTVWTQKGGFDIIFLILHLPTVALQ